MYHLVIKRSVDTMPEIMKLINEYIPLTIRPGFDPVKTGRSIAEEFLRTIPEFENKVNQVLKEGWTLVNATTSPMGTGVIMTAILKKQA